MIIIILLCIALQIIPSQVLVEAKRYSSISDLTQLEGEAAMIMAMLDLSAIDMGKRINSNRNKQQIKRRKPNAERGGDKEGILYHSN